MAIAQEFGGEEALDTCLRHSWPVSRAPIAMTFASLWLRASSADSGSDTSADRQAGLRLAAIEMPIPEPHSAIPNLASPVSIALAIL